MSKPNSGSRLAAFTALCADHQPEVSQVARAALVGSAIVLAIVAFLMRELLAHPLPPIASELMAGSAYGGFDAMVLPTVSAADQPPVDATAILSGMFMAITLVTAGFAGLTMLTECVVRAGAFAHRIGSKLPHAEGGD
jgi:hypothetical protein